MLDGWLILLLLFTFLSLKSALNMGQFEGTISDSVLRGKSNHGTKPGHHNKPHLNEKTLAIVVGTQKGGTTALEHFLLEHPECQFFSGRLEEETVTIGSEMHFFDKYPFDDQQIKRNTDGSFPTEVIPEVLKRYEWHWNMSTPEHKVVFDKSPEYMLLPQAAHGIKSIVPFANLIMVLRDPVERAYSHYKMAKKILGTNTSFTEAVEADIKLLTKAGVIGAVGKNDRDKAWAKYIENEDLWSGTFKAIVGRGLYSLQLRVLWKLYNDEERKELFLIMKTNDLVPDASGKINLRPVTDFLGLSEANVYQHGFRAPSPYPIDNATKTMLYDLYEPFNRELKEYLGQEWENPWAWAASP